MSRSKNAVDSELCDNCGITLRRHETFLCDDCIDNIENNENIGTDSESEEPPADY